MLPRTLVPALGILAAVTLGCQDRARLAPPAARAASFEQLKAEGDALFARREYAPAASKYEAARLLNPHDVSLRFMLATAVSHLDRVEQATEHFRWVVRHGEPRSTEVETARQWLARARHASDTGEAEDDTPTTGKVRGQTAWGSIDPRERLVPLRIVLEDELGGPVKFSRRFRLGHPYEFANVPPGRYRLSARTDDRQLWEATVTVEAGQESVLDLTSANSPVSTEEFPESDR